MAKTAQFLKRHNYDPAYIWVLEQKTSQHPHYHCIFLMNGHKTQSGGLVLALLTRYWGNTLEVDADGLVHYCNYTIEGAVCTYGIMVHRGIGIPMQVYGMMDYLSKNEGKGEPKDGLRDFGMSRLKPGKHGIKNEEE